ncbi:hypothetical protein ZOSMA_91G00200 [Zostera marina]|uniref:Uncharacterized protein n=1 Tax=Zostera marina TaxID=29655 RepID=A0A0K9NJ17_ZOSMR|nr:hypothetical protein ZOSMA_91G00200 [Zostera marina]
MQRQSLGSWTSDEEENGGGGETATEDESMKSKTVLRFTSKERTIHLIPIVIFLCFLILYMVSNDPSPAELSGKGQIARLYKKISSQFPEVQDIGIISNRRFKELVKVNNDRKW